MLRRIREESEYEYNSPNFGRGNDKSDPMIKLLAQVRKLGMDILFPQTRQDKVLVCIYVAIRCMGAPAHRELIDMVVYIRDSGIVGNLDFVSKTKLRGVLALLKHGELLVTKGEEGTPVRLYLAPHINSLKDLRISHDKFITSYLIMNDSFLPSVKTKLVWTYDDKTQDKRLKFMTEMSMLIEKYYYIQYSEDKGR